MSLPATPASAVCVFCGSSSGRQPAYHSLAEALADALVEQGIGLVYGGARIGLMGMVAERVLTQGGHVVGVIPEALRTREVAHDGLSELHVVDDMHARKAMMAVRSTGFIALPGGLGTLEELFEVLTWAQLGFHGKPCGLLNVNGFYDQLLGFLDHACNEGFMRPDHRQLLLTGDSPDALLRQMQTYKPDMRDKLTGI